MKKQIVFSLAVAMYWAAPAMAASPSFDVPAECKNLALMEAQLLQTFFYDGQMGGKAKNPSTLTLKTNNGLKIAKVEYLGGDGEADDPNQGKYPCDKDPSLCTNPAGAGGSIDWARVTVSNGDAKFPATVAEVIVSMGSRGGCSISSGKVPAQQ